MVAAPNEWPGPTTASFAVYSLHLYISPTTTTKMNSITDYRGIGNRWLDSERVFTARSTAVTHSPTRLRWWHGEWKVGTCGFGLLRSLHSYLTQPFCCRTISSGLLIWPCRLLLAIFFFWCVESGLQRFLFVASHPRYFLHVAAGCSQFSNQPLMEVCSRSTRRPTCGWCARDQLQLPSLGRHRSSVCLRCKACCQ